jgi:hypothetical protein
LRFQIRLKAFWEIHFLFISEGGKTLSSQIIRFAGRDSSFFVLPATAPLFRCFLHLIYGYIIGYGTSRNISIIDFIPRIFEKFGFC